MNQPGMVANPVQGQLNIESFPVPVRAWEFGLARQVQPSRPAYWYLYHELWAINSFCCACMERYNNKRGKKNKQETFLEGSTPGEGDC